ncbi:mannitol dehydrogenase family protein [Leucobacter sp. CSA1]|uniref:Mannitol-1-phosphate 5-dehydrogenase n=1 Tax=Leucobacter chromiisoli TaxID=2796471 RepID=A0A934Q700_9MICO|nr:mannitol dehydrogenase family protein [Leucobacter chromiisoli]MBK0419460.1 mannitol dehydrogenase family protein [Leucobacter chromiisoli]
MIEIDSGADVALPAYDRTGVTVGIAHFGVGNFHRAHQALFIDRCLHRPGQQDWGIFGIGAGDSPASRIKADAFERQGGLYTLTEFAPDGGHSSRVIGSILEYAHAPADYDRVVRALGDPRLRIVTLTITEGGYLVDPATGRVPEDHPAVLADAQGDRPTVFGLLARALAGRRGAGIAPFTVVSCDNLRHNGDVARAALTGVAAAIDPELARWIGEHVAFPNSMVDRIVPAVGDAERQRLNELTGVDDAMPVMAESYLQWVLEDDFPAGRPELEAVGVEFVEDITTHETMKGRILNASHVLLSFPSLLAGYRHVHEALADPLLRGFAERFLLDDVIPVLDAPAGVSLPDYAASVLERFANPAVGDQWVRIATDGATKIGVFHTATLEALLRADGDTRRQALMIACYERFLGGVDERGVSFEVGEPTLSDADRDRLRDADGLGILRIAPLAPLGLDRDAAFAADYARARDELAARGVLGAIEALGLA